jgi:hypothetical protein
MEHLNESYGVEIKDVKILGNRRTKDSFFSSEFKSSFEKKNLHDLHASLCKVTDKLLGSNLFDLVDVHLKVDSVEKEKYICNLEISIKEKSIPTLTMQSYVKTGAINDVGFELQGALRNPTGYGEVFKLSSTTSNTGSHEFNSNLSIPNRGFEDNFTGDLNISFKSAVDNQHLHASSFKQNISSFLVDFITNNKKHQITAECSLRDEIPYIPQLNNIKNDSNQVVSVSSPNTLTKNLAELFTSKKQASSTIINSATTSLKTSFKHVYTVVDTLDSCADPSNGKLLKSSFEVALPVVGDVYFLKYEIISQYHKKLGKDLFQQNGLTFSICGSLGFMLPFLNVFEQNKWWNTPNNKNNNKNLKYLKSNLLSDRFF